MHRVHYTKQFNIEQVAQQSIQNIAHTHSQAIRQYECVWLLNRNGCLYIATFARRPARIFLSVVTYHGVRSHAHHQFMQVHTCIVSPSPSSSFRLTLSIFRQFTLQALPNRSLGLFLRVPMVYIGMNLRARIMSKTDSTSKYITTNTHNICTDALRLSSQYLFKMTKKMRKKKNKWIYSVFVPWSVAPAAFHRSMFVVIIVTFGRRRSFLASQNWKYGGERKQQQAASCCRTVQCHISNASSTIVYARLYEGEIYIYIHYRWTIPYVQTYI